MHHLPNRLCGGSGFIRPWSTAQTAIVDFIECQVAGMPGAATSRNISSWPPHSTTQPHGSRSATRKWNVLSSMAYTPPTNGSYISGKLNSSCTNCRAHASSPEGYIRFVEPRGQTRWRPSESTPPQLYLIKVPPTQAICHCSRSIERDYLIVLATHTDGVTYTPRKRKCRAALLTLALYFASLPLSQDDQRPQACFSKPVEPTRKFPNTSLAIALDENYYNYLEKKKKKKKKPS